MGNLWRPSPDSGIAAFIASRASFFRAHATLSACVGAALILSFGFGMSNYAISIDEEIHLWKDYTLEWYLQGRPTVTLIKLALGDLMPMPFVSLATSLIFILFSFLLWASLLNDATKDRRVQFHSLLIFGIFYSTVPVNSYFLTFSTFNIEVSFGLILTALAASLAWRWSRAGGGWPAFLLCAAFSFMSAGIYQSLVVLCLAGLLSAFCAHRLSVDVNEEPAGRFIVSMVLAVAPIVLGTLASLLVARMFLPSNGYAEAFVQWGRADFSTIREALGAYVITTLSGRDFPGGWVVLASALSGALAILLAVRRAFTTGDWLAPLMVLALFALPFLLSVAIGAPLPKRTQQTLPLVFGVMWVLLALLLPPKSGIKPAFIVAALLLTSWNAQANTRLWVSKYLAFNFDRTLAHEIASALHAAGWDGAPMPVLQVGRPVIPERRYWTRDETIGASFFQWADEGRGLVFMYVLGYQLMEPTTEQFAEAVRLAKTMPIWPLPGSVILRDGMGVVNFGTP